jgi:hypothetical protein
MLARTHAHTHTHAHTSALIHMISTHVRAHINTFTCTYRHTRARTHTHTRTCTHAHTQKCMQPRVELSHSLGQGLSRDPIESTPKDGGRTLAVRLQARQHAYRDTRLTQIPHLDCVIPPPSPRHHRMHLPRHRHIQNPAIVALCIQLCALLPRCRRVPRASAIASTSRQNRYSAGARWCVGQEPQIGFARGAVGSALSDAQHPTHNTQHTTQVT